MKKIKSFLGLRLMISSLTAAKCLKTKVYHVDNPGDVLFYRNETIQE
jgi:hypothetical protein